MIIHRFNNGIQYDSGVMDRIIERIFIDYKLSLSQIAIIQLSDNQLLEINKSHLNHDYYTDIITFTLNDNPIEGELYISYDRVRENENVNNTIHEIYRIIIHGCLHLCGLEDFNQELKKEMRREENMYLAFVSRETKAK